MAVTYEKVVAEDVNLGFGTTTVTMPAGGSATGTLVGIHTFINRTYNAADFGCAADGTTDDTAAIQAAINQAVSDGGGTVLLPAGTIRLTKALTLNMGSATVAVHIKGGGDYSTELSQTTSGADIWQIGATGADVAENLVITDLRMTGGHYALNLNNAINGTFERLRMENATVGIYGQGQNERHTFKKIQIVGMSQNGVYMGATNGGAGVVLDHPEFQKCLWDELHITGTTGGAALYLTAGIIGGNQQASGYSSIRRLRTESNQQNIVDLHFCAAMMLDGWTDENAPALSNTYTQLNIADATTLYARGLFLDNSTANVFKYFINVNGALLALSESSVPGTAGTTNILINGSALFVSVIVKDNASIVFASSASRIKSSLIYVWDASANLLTFSDATLGWVQQDVNGTILGNLRLFGKLLLSTAAGVANRLIEIAGGSSDSALLRFTLDSSKTTLAEFYQGASFRGEMDCNSAAVSIYNGNITVDTPVEAGGCHVMTPSGGGVNFGLGTQTTADFGGGQFVLSIRKTAFPPSTNPSNAGILYVDNTGNLKYRGTSGTVTTVAVA